MVILLGQHDHRTPWLHLRAFAKALSEYALNVVEFMGKAGLVTVPREPTDGMGISGMEVSCVGEERARVIFRAMIAAADDGVGVAAFAN
jgi:hypothetical protein